MTGMLDPSIFDELDRDACVSPSAIGVASVSQFAEDLEAWTPQSVRENSIAIASATRIRSCRCHDALDVREESGRLECGSCGSPICARRSQ